MSPRTSFLLLALRLFFLHFWGHADPLALARGLGAALRHTNSVPATR